MTLIRLIFPLLLLSCAGVPRTRVAENNRGEALWPEKQTIHMRVVLTRGENQYDFIVLMAADQAGLYRLQFYNDMGILLLDISWFGAKPVIRSNAAGIPARLISKGFHPDFLFLFFSRPQLPEEYGDNKNGIFRAQGEPDRPLSWEERRNGKTVRIASVTEADNNGISALLFRNIVKNYTMEIRILDCKEGIPETIMAE